MVDDLTAGLDATIRWEEDEPAAAPGKPGAAPALPPAWATVNLPKKLAHREKAKRRVFYDYSEVHNAVNLIQPLPARGETIHAVMDSHFKGVDLVPAILRLAARPARELIITTLGFNQRDAACLCELAERGDIERLAMVCSSFFAEKDQAAYNYARERFAKVGGQPQPQQAAPLRLSSGMGYQDVIDPMKTRIIKREHPDGRVTYVIQTGFWFFRWWWTDGSESCGTGYYPFDCYGTLEEAQSNLWRFDGSQPKETVVQP